MGQKVGFGGHALTPALLLFVAHAAFAGARPAADAPARPVGIVEQPCTFQVSPSDAEKILKDVRERILDPNDGGHEVEPDAGAASARSAADEDHARYDWAQLCHYRAENAALHRATAPRVVFIGDSITEYWKVAHPDFFGDSYIDRGIRAQTTAQMLVRFHQDVIALKPAVVHIMGGTNDIAGAAGPTTLEAIKSNIISMVDLAMAYDIRVVLASVPPAGMFWWHPNVQDPAQHIVELNEWLRRYAREKNLIFVDYHEPLADERDAMKQTFSNDGVHPNRDGYSVIEPLTRHAVELALASLGEGEAKGVTPKPLPKGKGMIKH